MGTKLFTRGLASLLLCILCLSLSAQAVQRFIALEQIDTNVAGLKLDSVICLFTTTEIQNIRTDKQENARLYDHSNGQYTYILQIKYLPYDNKRKFYSDGVKLTTLDDEKDIFTLKPQSRWHFKVITLRETILSEPKSSDNIIDPNLSHEHEIACIDIKHQLAKLTVEAKRSDLVTKTENTHGKDGYNHTTLYIDLNKLEKLRYELRKEYGVDYWSQFKEATALILKSEGCVSKTIYIAEVKDFTEAHRVTYRFTVINTRPGLFPTSPKDTVIKESTIIKDTVIMEKVRKGMMFMEACVSGSPHPFWSTGITIGGMRKVGGYVSLMSSFQFKGLRTPMEEGHMYNLTGKSQSIRFSATAGIIFKVAEPVAMHLGGGFGFFAKTFNTQENEWYRLPNSTLYGADIALGVDFFIKKAAISLEFLTTQFKTIEGKLGIGFNTRRTTK